MEFTKTNIDLSHDFEQQLKRLNSLAGLTNIDTKWIQDARVTSLELLRILPLHNPGTNQLLLETFAQFVKMCPDDKTLQSNFAHVTFLHLFDTHLYVHLRQALASNDPAEVNSGAFTLPQWWPEFGVDLESSTFASPFDFKHDLGRFVAEHATQVHSIIQLAVEIWNQVSVLITNTLPPWNCFAALISIFLRSKAHRDLATLILCHDDKVVNVLHRQSVLAPSASNQRYAKFLLELLLIRPAVFGLLSACHKYPGATRLIQLYSPQQQIAFEVATNSPFRFVFDLLNHASGTSCYKNAVIVTGISVCSYKLGWMSSRSSLNEIYNEFNNTSSVSSLLAALTQFGCIIAQCLMENHGDRSCSSMYFRSQNVFALSALPPLAKPNYFFCEQKSAPANETLATLMKLDEFDELHRSLMHILRFITVIIDSELSQLLGLMPNEALAQKVYICKVRPIYLLILLALKCNEKVSEPSLTAQKSSDLVLEIGEKLLSIPDQALAWTTLFNSATEGSYNDLSAQRIWLEYIRSMCSRNKREDVKDFINEKCSKFSAIFSPDSARVTSAGPHASTKHMGHAVIAKSEYMFLYQGGGRNRGDLDEMAQSKMANHYVSGGRQQSVHVDKYSRDRM